MDTERIRQGATFEITLTDTDVTAETATITVSDDTGVIATETATFATVDEVYSVTLQLDTEDIEVGDYEYMYTITYSDGTVVKLPDADCEDDSCGLPAFIVCEANDIAETS